MGQGRRIKYGRTRERREAVRIRAKVLGLYVREYGTDIGEIHMRFFTDPHADYFQGGYVFEARVLREAEIFIIGYTAGKELPKW
jgi:hypothetical protein